MSNAFASRRNFLSPTFAATAASALVAAVCACGAAASNVDLPRYPALSPDGSTVVFTWRGDLWRAPTAGGAATRLTANPANETRSGFTPDGARIVFESDREGVKNLWSMATDGSDLRQITEIDAPFALASVGMLEGKPVAFIDTTVEGDLYRSSRPYVVSIEGGTPVRLHDAFGGAANASTDGARVLFERGGSGWSRRGYNGPDNRNVWLFDVAAKSFAPLTKYDGNDGLPRFISADEYVYISDRGTGTLNLFRAKVGDALDAGKRLTDFDGADVHGLAVSADGKTAVFGVLGDLWRIDLSKDGASPEKLAFTAAADTLADREFKQVGRAPSEIALSPDGKTIAFIADGDVFVRATEDKAPTRRVTEGEGRERDIAWSADGLTLYFASDMDDGAEGSGDSLFAAKVAETRSEARERGKLKKPEVAKPETKPESKPEVKAEPKPEAGAAPASETPAAAATPEAAKPATAPEAAKPAEAQAEKKPAESKSEKPAEKPAEKKDPKLDSGRWADAVRFDVTPLVAGPHNDRRPVASPDGKTLFFMRDLADLTRLDLATGEVKVIHPGWDDETEVVFSPDGTLIALAEHDQDFNKDIWILAADGSKPAVNVTRHPDNDGSPRFSADNRMLAFTSERTNEEFDVWVVMLDRDLEGYSTRDLEQYFKDAAEAQKKRKPLEAKAEAKPEATPAAPAPAATTDAPPEAKDPEAKTPEAKTTEAKAPETPAPAAEAAPAKDPFEGLELDDAYLRMRRVTSLPGDEVNLEILPTGERIVFVGTEGKDRGIFSVKWDGSEQKKVAPGAAIVGLNFAGDRIVALGAGGAQTIGLTGDAKSFDISATSEVELAKRNAQKLEEVSRIMGGKFYKSPAEKGLDWPALTERYRDLASRARTADEFDSIANMFIGHLDASHLGVRSAESGNGPSAAPSRRAQGRLGVATVEAEGGRRVVGVLPDSPAALANPRIEVGDTIIAIDFEKVDATKPLEATLAGKIGQEVFVTFTRPQAAKAEEAAKPAEEAKPADAAAVAEVAAVEVAEIVDAPAAPAAPATPTVTELAAVIVPMGSMEERALRYRDEVLENARKVHELSGGRIGYLHIQSMDQASLDRFERDLYAAAAGRDALLVDVRNNGGGFTADRLLASIDVRPHAYAIPREGDLSRKTSYPQDRLFIQRYTLPMAMLCNEKSFSNAEITSHAFKTLGRGPLVGQQTAGGVISTGSESLVDGTTVRMPFRGWYLPDGTDMEENGAMPDFVVLQTPEDESREFDAQLAKAVEELMKKLPKK